MIVRVAALLAAISSGVVGGVPDKVDITAEQDAFGAEPGDDAEDADEFVGEEDAFGAEPGEDADEEPGEEPAEEPFEEPGEEPAEEPGEEPAEDADEFADERGDDAEDAEDADEFAGEDDAFDLDEPPSGSQPEPADNLADTVKKIVAGELDNQFNSGQHGGNTPIEKVKGCVKDKIDAIQNESPGDWKMDFLIDLAACCVPEDDLRTEPHFPGCVEGMAEAYKELHAAETEADMQASVQPLLEKYVSSLKEEL
jgi:hypothetical protein